MTTIPLTLVEANRIVTLWHRHHKTVVGHRFSIGCKTDRIVGAAIVGRPVAPKTEQYLVAEVTRLVTDGTKNACSYLYSACARIARQMGFTKIQTFILPSESGVSLQAAGWKCEGVTHDHGNGWNSRSGRRTDQPIDKYKQRWVKLL